MFHLFEKIEKGDVYVIAEMSANPGGSLDNALELVRKAKEAGADCLKIQTYTADTLTSIYSDRILMLWRRPVSISPKSWSFL